MCMIGRCTEFIYMSWPECVNTCVSRICPNNKELSNIEHYLCKPQTGLWTCVNKQDSNFGELVCPVW